MFTCVCECYRQHIELIMLPAAPLFFELLWASSSFTDTNIYKVLIQYSHSQSVGSNPFIVNYAVLNIFRFIFPSPLFSEASYIKCFDYSATTSATRSIKPIVSTIGSLYFFYPGSRLANKLGMSQFYQRHVEKYYSNWWQTLSIPVQLYLLFPVAEV